MVGLKQTDIKVVDLSKKFEQDGVSSIIYTDIARDGMLQGVNVDGNRRILLRKPPFQLLPLAV